MFESPDLNIGTTRASFNMSRHTPLKIHLSHRAVNCELRFMFHVH